MAFRTTDEQARVFATQWPVVPLTRAVDTPLTLFLLCSAQLWVSRRSPCFELTRSACAAHRLASSFLIAHVLVSSPENRLETRRE